MGVRTSSIPPETSDPDTKRVLDGLRRIVRVLRESSRSVQKNLGLSAAQLFAMQQLVGQPPMSLGQLAQRTMTHESSISVVVSRLVARGLVKRKGSRVDRRRVELSLTAAGRSLLTAAPEAAQERLLSALSQLHEAELLQLSALLGKVVELSDASGERPSLFFEDGPALFDAKARGGHARR